MKATTLKHHGTGGGPITTRTGAGISAVIVIAYVVIVCGCVAYFYRELHRTPTSQSSALRVLNAGMEASWMMMLGVVTIVVVFALGVVVFSLGKATDR